MTQQSTSLLVGLLAGVSAALLLVSAGSPSGIFLQLLFVIAVTLPILIVGLGWSNLASIVALASAVAIIALAGTPRDALEFAIILLAPAAWIAHLSNLARPAEEIGGPQGAVAWYPLSGILFNIGLCVSIGLIGVRLASGHEPALAMAGQQVDLLVDLLKESNPDFQLPTDDVAQIKQLFFYTILTFHAATWVLILFAGWYVASAIVRMSGRSKRPKDDIPSQLRMPRIGVIALAAGVAMTFLPGGVSLIGLTLAGAFGMGFSVAGFAIAHHRTRGKPARGLVLWAAYLVTILFTLPLAFFLFLGLFDTARTLTVTGSGPNSKP